MRPLKNEYKDCAADLSILLTGPEAERERNSVGSCCGGRGQRRSRSEEAPAMAWDRRITAANGGDGRDPVVVPWRVIGI